MPNLNFPRLNDFGFDRISTLSSMMAVRGYNTSEESMMFMVNQINACKEGVRLGPIGRDSLYLKYVYKTKGSGGDDFYILIKNGFIPSIEVINEIDAIVNVLLAQDSVGFDVIGSLDIGEIPLIRMRDSIIEVPGIMKAKNNPRIFRKTHKILKSYLENGGSDSNILSFLGDLIKVCSPDSVKKESDDESLRYFSGEVAIPPVDRGRSSQSNSNQTSRPNDTSFTTGAILGSITGRRRRSGY